MENFIIISKPLPNTPFSINFINKEIIRLHEKNCNVGIFHNDTRAIIVREIDDSIFWTTEYNLINYKKKYHKIINYIKDKLPNYVDFPIPKKFEG